VPSQSSYIAIRELTAKDASRGSFEIRVCIGHPYQTESDDWARLRRAKEEIDDLDKSASFVGNASPRRSTSSLGAI
jgi:hypothetical protein